MKARDFVEQYLLKHGYYPKGEQILTVHDLYHMHARIVEKDPDRVKPPEELETPAPPPPEDDSFNPVLGKHMIAVGHDRSIEVSEFLAELERRISADWTQRNAYNKKQGRMSNILLEDKLGRRHALVRTSDKTMYVLPNTNTEHRGDLKIRLPNQSHSYLPNVSLKGGVFVDLKNSKFLGDHKPWPRVDPPRGW